jgi:hypothetical protein
MSSDAPETPDPAIPQDPGIPGFDPPSDTGDAPLPDAKDETAEERERLDEPDREGHMTAPVDADEDENRT